MMSYPRRRDSSTHTTMKTSGLNVGLTCVSPYSISIYLCFHHNSSKCLNMLWLSSSCLHFCVLIREQLLNHAKDLSEHLGSSDCVYEVPSLILQLGHLTALTFPVAFLFPLSFQAVAMTVCSTRLQPFLCALFSVCFLLITLPFYAA